jgi:hypothetical protein
MYNLPLAVHEEEVHTNHEYANLRADTTRKQYQHVSPAMEGGSRDVVGGGRGKYMGRCHRKIFPFESCIDHDGAGLPQIQIYCVSGVSWTQGMCQVHGRDGI